MTHLPGLANVRPGSTIVRGASRLNGMPDAPSYSALRSCAEWMYAQRSGTQGSELTVIKFIIGLWVNISYFGNVVE